MMEQSPIHQLLTEINNFGIMGLGKGPKHPLYPNLAIAIEVEKFLNDNPFLHKDKDYVEFLEVYAGAGIEHPEEQFVVDLFGFTDVSSDFTELDESPLIDENGFMAFCGGYAFLKQSKSFKDAVTQGFFFDASGKRKWGIYRGEDNGNHYWYCSTFAEWLKILVDTKARMPLRLQQS